MLKQGKQISFKSPLCLSMYMMYLYVACFVFYSSCKKLKAKCDMSETTKIQIKIPWKVNLFKQIHCKNFWTFSNLETITDSKMHDSSKLT